jgi:hypothetical protein
LVDGKLDRFGLFEGNYSSASDVPLLAAAIRDKNNIAITKDLPVRGEFSLSFQTPGVAKLIHP